MPTFRSMQREAWDPHLAGTLIRNKVLWKPHHTAESTLWESTITDPRVTLGSPSDLAMASLYSSAIDCTHHVFRAVFTHGLVPDEMLVGLRDLPNMRLAVGPIHTQAEADLWIPQLLETKALTKEVVLDPREPISLRPYIEHLDAVLVRGGDVPLNPNDIQDLMHQAVDARVHFFLTWGVHVPVGAPTQIWHYQIGAHWYGAVEDQPSDTHRLDGEDWRGDL